MTPAVGMLIIGIWNILVFVLYGVDKAFAKLDLRRVSEAALLLCSLLAGGVGAWCGMHIFHHKIRKLRFRVVSLLSVAITLGVSGVLVYMAYFK